MFNEKSHKSVSTHYRFNNNKNWYFHNKIPFSADFCNTGEQDGDETGVDCGGSCTPCGGKYYRDNVYQPCIYCNYNLLKSH